MHRRTLLLSLGALCLPRLARAEPRVEKDVVYGEPGGTKLRMDIYRPDGPGPHPAVLMIHGGGWIGGDKSGYQQMGRFLAGQGYVACAVGYRLAPQFPYPAAFDDCQRAVRWIRAHARDYQVDRRAVGALGASAGGHLVGMLACRDTRDNSDRALSKFSSRPNAVVPYYGAFELVRMWDIEQARRPLTAWLGGGPEGREKLYAETSPVALANRKACPHLIIHGDADTVNPVEQSRLYHEALRKHGVDSTLMILPGANHGWPADSDYAKQTDAAMLEFFRKHLRAR